MTKQLTNSMEQSPSWELIVPQLIKKFTSFYGAPGSITAFTKASHLRLSWTRSHQSMPPPPFSLRSILILSSQLRLGLARRPFPTSFSTKTLCTPLMSFACVMCPAQLTLLYLTTQWRTHEFCSVGGSTNSVEDRGQRERGYGGGSPLVRGFLN